MEDGYGAPPPTRCFSNPFGGLIPSTFPPGTDPSVVATFQLADADGSGFIDDFELQKALSSGNHGFSMRTVRLLMYHFTGTNTRKIGPMEFTALFHHLRQWGEQFENFDQDRSGKIDKYELKEVLLSCGYSISPTVLDFLVAKFDKHDGYAKAIEYDIFIECCLTVKGLTERFKANDPDLCGSATFEYEEFMLTVLPFIA